MTDINGNFNNYDSSKDYNKKLNNSKPEGQVDKSNLGAQEDLPDYGKLPAADVLGRSQVASPKGSDPSKSVDEAINLTTMLRDCPQVLSCADEVFDITYNRAIKEGASSEEAYAKATLSTEEFLKLAVAQAST